MVAWAGLEPATIAGSKAFRAPVALPFKATKPICRSFPAVSHNRRPRITAFGWSGGLTRTADPEDMNLPRYHLRHPAMSKSVFPAPPLPRIEPMNIIPAPFLRYDHLRSGNHRWGRGRTIFAAYPRRRARFAPPLSCRKPRGPWRIEPRL